MTEPTQPAAENEDNRRRRLVFRAQHRGTYENDLLIGAFVKTRIASFTGPELDELETLLELPDPDLANWLTGRTPIPQGRHSAMLQRIRAAALNRS